ncbi:MULTISPECIES: UDP-N-acetylmuramate--L-alanine ligase [unclassified Lactococcus]|uniref:UDP-N-acetylmuramate--L-alanine ligase n=1 Tax=unclassified Lactococcus TaxID=2643510 RepID=UPI0011CC7D0A|nr:MULTISPECIES: UDP-N-acetylmuramate--L-alanine ligase [unclassified Lactococcus]MQW22892.1 UDP-N-acetylmuramate--L-alanine ligase [Lactococcus sp. dk101]TXK44561.1 UDP-N-acetylmuramate--L-alanine ligase [Lactococcus sp. dk310]TXK50414.1 UDP-N-acetylmuramate--L-alanine ligase [Lactococcus sp. dk322]
MEKTYHFIGIKGSGMSALALMLHQMGKNVQGSDSTDYFFTQRGLELAGIPLLPFDEKNIKPGDVLIVGNSFNDENNVEVAYADKNGFPYKRYHEFLGEFMEEFTSIGVAGAHGKTSTTGMLAHVMSSAVDTSYLIGDGTGRGNKDSKYFVFESDEYQRHFMPYHPEYTIMTNIDFDHPDFFHGIDDVTAAFQDYAKNIKKGIFAYGDDENLRKLVAPVPVYYYGFTPEDDYQALNLVRTTRGSSFDAYYKNELIGHFVVPTFGKHNVLNALAVVGVCHQLGLDMQDIADHMLTFRGVKRRFTEKKVNETVIIDDFAHHPTEIEATIDAARQKYPDREVVAVFQPHTFTRTIAFADDFARVLDHADTVYLAQIYGSAREVDHHQITAQDLADKVRKPARVISVDNVSPLLDHERAVYVFMGAGNIQQYEQAFEKLLSQLTENVQ